MQTEGLASLSHEYLITIQESGIQRYALTLYIIERTTFRQVIQVSHVSFHNMQDKEW